MRMRYVVGLFLVGCVGGLVYAQGRAAPAGLTAFAHELQVVEGPRLVRNDSGVVTVSYKVKAMGMDRLPVPAFLWTRTVYMKSPTGLRTIGHATGDGVVRPETGKPEPIFSEAFDVNQPGNYIVLVGAQQVSRDGTPLVEQNENDPDRPLYAATAVIRFYVNMP